MTDRQTDTQEDARARNDAGDDSAQSPIPYTCRLYGRNHEEEWGNPFYVLQGDTWQDAYQKGTHLMHNVLMGVDSFPFLRMTLTKTGEDIPTHDHIYVQEEDGTYCMTHLLDSSDAKDFQGMPEDEIPLLFLDAEDMESYHISYHPSSGMFRLYNRGFDTDSCIAEENNVRETQQGLASSTFQEYGVHVIFSQHLLRLIRDSHPSQETTPSQETREFPTMDPLP